MSRLIDADEVKRFYNEEFPTLDNGVHWSRNDIIMNLSNIPTVKAIPIEVFYKMIHNALADTKKENWEPEECPYDYSDGNRNAINCMLDILCGDKDGDHDKFWEDYSHWRKKMIWWCRHKNKPCSMANENGYCQITACCNTSKPTVKAIPIERLLNILPQYDDYIHLETYPYNETMEDIYSKGYEDGWNVCLKHIKEELEDWEKENE